jgi:hypothetical protein
MIKTSSILMFEAGRIEWDLKPQTGCQAIKSSQCEIPRNTRFQDPASTCKWVVNATTKVVEGSEDWKWPNTGRFEATEMHMGLRNENTGVDRRVRRPKG